MVGSNDGEISRRRLLAGGVTGAFTWSSGCLGSLRSFFHQSPKPQLIFIENYTEKHQTVHISIERDDELVYWKTHEIEASETPYEGDRESSGVALEEFSETEGKYAVNVSNRDYSDWERRNLAKMGVDSECVVLYVPIRESNDVSLTIFDTTRCHPWSGNRST